MTFFRTALEPLLSIPQMRHFDSLDWSPIATRKKSGYALCAFPNDLRTHLQMITNHRHHLDSDRALFQMPLEWFLLMYRRQTFQQVPTYSPTSTF